MQSYQNWALACVATAVLTACTTLDTQHPDKMYQQAIMNNLQKDNQYNFSAEATIDWQKNNQYQQDDEANVSKVVKAPHRHVNSTDEEDQYDDDEVAQVTQMWDELSKTLIEGAAEYPVVSSFMKHSAVKVDGAMDLKQGQVEVTPSIKIGTANYGGWAQLPIHIDGRKERILVDTQGYAGWLQKDLLGDDEDMQRRENTQAALQRLENGALLELSAPKDSTVRYPIQTSFKAIPKGLEGYLNAIDAKAFSLQPMDEYGKSLGATHRVSLEYDTVQSIKWQGAFLKAYQDEFERLKQEEPEAGVTEEGYETLQSILMLGAMMTSEMLPDEKTCQESAEAAAECLKKERELAQLSQSFPKLQHSLYLNSRGRILGVQDQMVLQHSSTPKALVYSSKMKLYNYGRPVFGMKVQNRPTVSIWDIIDSKKQVSSWNDDEDVADAAAVAAEAAAVAVMD